MITILFLFLIYEINQLWTAEMKWKWSSQWTQFMQLRKEAWKNSGLQRDGNIWTHNWPAPNVCGFIAQLVEHRTGNREVTGSNPIEVMNFFFQASLRNCVNCIHCDDHFFIFISFPQFMYGIYHISLTLISFTGTYEPTIDPLPTSVAS